MPDSIQMKNAGQALSDWRISENHNTRTEVMIRKPVEEPCCSELTDPYIDE